MGDLNDLQHGGVSVIRAAFDAAKIIQPTAVSNPDLNLAERQRSDVGNAERFIARRGADFLFVRDIGWHVWTGTHWSRDDGDMGARVAAHQVAASIVEEASAIAKAGPNWRTPKLEDENDRDYRDRVLEEFDDRLTAHHRFAVSSSNSARLSSMLQEAAPYLTVDIDAMDTHPFLLTVKNGTLHLRAPGGDKSDDPAHELKPHDRADRIARLAEVHYDPDAECPKFMKFLARVQPDESMQRYLARLAGYMMTGSTREQILSMFVGIGANGKTTWIEAVSFVLGEYATVIPFSSLLHDDRKSGSQATPDLARLPGRRLVAAVEPDVGARLSESVIKTLTGGDRMIVRHLNRDFFEFWPQFKLALAVNNKPDIRGTDDGIWRRIHVVDWPVQIPKEERDLQLLDKLKAEAPGILNWILGGYAEYREIGLAPPPSVLAATQAYRSERDPIGDFLASCTIAEPTDRVRASELYEAYTLWCKVNAREPTSSNFFGRIVVGRPLPGGGTIGREKSNVMHYRGLKLVAGAVDACRSALKPASAGGAESISGEPPSGHPTHHDEN